MTKTIHYFLGFIIVVGLVCIVYKYWIFKESRQFEHFIVAHACSAIDGHKYTNSKEALFQAIGKGVKYIEIDLSLTSDSVLVGCHDWEVYHLMIGDSTDSVQPVAYSEFSNALLYGCLHPITYEDILKIWREYPDLVLITDKISEPRILNQFFKEIKNRMIVECMSLDDYYSLSEQGFSVLFSRYPSPFLLFQQTTKALISFTEVKTPKNYSFCARQIPPILYGILPGCRYAVSIPDEMVTREKADSVFALDRRVMYVYTDEI